MLFAVAVVGGGLVAAGLDFGVVPGINLFNERAAALGAKPLDEPGRGALFDDGFCASDLGSFGGGPPTPSSGFRFCGETGRAEGFDVVSLCRGRVVRLALEGGGADAVPVSSEMSEPKFWTLLVGGLSW